MKDVKTKRVYEDPANNDGYRLLIDRVWPRGVSKEDAKLNEWNKDLAPSTDLRKWFGHEAEKFDEFKKRYKKELKDQKEDLNRIHDIVKDKRVCLLYGSKNEKHNQAVVLKEVLEDF
jgi:uncharacterized protein YeaO (DUF488 family)